MQLKRRYRGRRRTHRGWMLLILLLTAVFLVSCVAGSNPLWVRGMFGIDVAQYGGEQVTQTLATDSEVAQMLCDMVGILTFGSTKLTPFESTAQAVRHYRDAILNDMLRDNYALYTGNSQLLAGVTAAYPKTVITTLIPRADFENTVFRYFGGTSVRHRDGEVFTYLSRVQAYTAPIQAWQSRVLVMPELVAETSHTYRMRFRLAIDGEISDLYTAVFVKREDQSCYFYSLTVEK